MKRYRMDVNPDRLVTRHFHLDHPEAEALHGVMAVIRQQHGVQDVTWTVADCTLNVLYDPAVEHVDDVTGALEEAGIAIHRSWKDRLSETLWRFDEALQSSVGGETERHTLGD